MNNEVVIHVKVDNDAKGGLTAAKSDFEKFGKDAEKSALAAGESIGQSLGQSITGGLSSAAEAAGPLIGSAIALGLAASPLIGATISGLIIGGAGVGGVVGGLVLASKDPRVQSAFKSTADGLKKQLTEASSSFIEPAIEGIHTLGGAIKAIDFKSIFADSSQFVAPLASGISTMVTGLGKGLKDMIAAAGPVIQVLSQGLADLGSVLGKEFSDMAKNSDDAAAGLKGMLTIVNAFVEGTFMLVNGLTEVYGVLEDIGATTSLDLLELSMRDATHVAEVGGQAMGSLVDKLAGVGDAGTTAVNGIESLQEALDNLTHTEKGMFDASTKAGEAIDNVTAAAKKNGRTLDSNTEKGRANRTALSNLAAALKTQYDATVAVNGAGPITDAVGEKNRRTFIHLATQLGLTKAQARHLSDEILGIPAKHETKIHADPEPAVTAARRAKGAIGSVPDSKTTKMYANTHDAAGRLAALQGQINAVHGKSVSVSVSVTGLERLSAAGHRIGGFKRSGGITGAANGATSTGLTWVGEDGPELLDLPPGTAVRSNPDSMRAASQSGGGGAVVLQFARSGDVVLDDLFQFLLTKMQATNRKRFGNSAERMLAG